MDASHGRARFCGPRSVEVGGEVLEGRFVWIAVGAVPMRLGIAGEKHIVTGTDFFGQFTLVRFLEAFKSALVPATGRFSRIHADRSERIAQSEAVSGVVAFPLSAAR